MKKFKKAIFISLAFVFLNINTAYAQVGDFGFFGGISEGRKLPKTTEQLVDTKKKKNKDELDAVYKEVIFLSGKPVTFEGQMKTTNSDTVSDVDTSGTYDVTYEVSPSNTTPADTSITRKIKYKVDYRKEGTQVVKDYKLDKQGDWDETITTPDGTFTLDNTQSNSTASILEDHTPGVTYYKGNATHRAVYTNDTDKIVLDISDSFYGYDCAWSSTETHRMDATVTTDDWQMQYQVRPSVSLSKQLQYSKNEPTAISFEGNYAEVMQNKSGLNYNIYVMPTQYTYTVPASGNVSIETYNTFEQLLAPDVSFLKGNFAEDDIKRLFSMQILDGDPKYYQPAQAITRGQYVQALTKAIKLPIEDPNANKRLRNKAPVNIVFPDVLPERTEYPYVMAAYRAGLAIGRDNGQFYIDSPIQRQEAIVILMRTIGLENLGLEPTPVTSFTDDSNIDSWAKKEIYAANRLGIISGDAEGKFRPTDYVSKAEAAAFINKLNSYMRTDLQTDYTEHIVNYSN